MRAMLVATMRNYLLDQSPDEHVWDFGSNYMAALGAHAIWAADVSVGLWEFRIWGTDKDAVMIKPGGIDMLDLRVMPDN